MTSSRRLMVLAFGLLLVGLLALPLGGAAASVGHAKRLPAVTRNSPVTRGSTYLAMGDSVVFGYQEPAVVPPPNYAKASSFQGYPEHLGAALHLRIANASCPGETSASLINAKALSNGCENAYRAHFPLHVRYKGSQLAYGVSYLRSHRQVKLVSLMVGANDLFLCQKTTPDACGSPAEQAAVFKKVAGNVRKILSAVRGQAGYRGQLVIVNYYSLNYGSAFINHVIQGLDRSNDQAAKPFGVRIADGFGEFKLGSRRSAGSPCTAGLLTQLGAPGTCGVHPSFAGQSLLAEAVLKAIRL
jgi:lysophospholipase L1-like esterase